MTTSTRYRIFQDLNSEWIIDSLDGSCIAEISGSSRLLSEELHEDFLGLLKELNEIDYATRRQFGESQEDFEKRKPV